jgi:uncharacterized protein YdeI (YjbR/CyaY-like superfamily)
MAMELKEGVGTFHAKSRKEWRKWLEENHQSEKSVWLIICKKGSDISSVYYPEAVDEALCFGWIDSKPNKRDDESYFQFFAKRNPKSNWSKVNKEKVETLIAQNLMTSAGLKIIEIAKQNGAWTALDEVENIIIPDDLQKAFDNNKMGWLLSIGISFLVLQSVVF